MRTEDLIRGLSADLGPAPALAPRLAAAAFAGLAAAAAALWLTLGFRADLPGSVLRPEIGLKIAAMAGLGVAALVALDRLARPGHAVATLAAGGALAAGAALTAWLAAVGAPVEQAGPLLRGAAACGVRIVLLSLFPFAGLVLALRAGAPTRPRATGAAAGAAAGAFAAAAYALHCPIEAGMVAAAWYLLAISLAAALGALAGRRLFAW